MVKQKWEVLQVGSPTDVSHLFLKMSIVLKVDLIHNTIAKHK